MDGYSLENPIGTSNSILIRAYQQREKDFLKSLNDILMQITKDSISKQMLAEKTSGQFIAKRVEEIIAKILHEDREAFIEELLSKLHHYEILLNKKITTDNLSKSYVFSNSGKLTRNIEQHSTQEKIQMMNEIKELKRQIEELKLKNNQIARSSAIISKPHTNLNSGSSSFMHIIAPLDITDLRRELANIESNNKVTKQLYSLTISKVEKMINIANSKIKEYVYLYIQDFKRNYEEVCRRHYEEESKSMVQNYLQKNDELDDKIKQMKKDFYQNNEEIQKLKSLNEGYMKRIKELEEDNSKFLLVNDKTNQKLLELQKISQKNEQDFAIKKIENDSNLQAKEQIRKEHENLKAVHNKLQENYNQMKNLYESSKQENQKNVLEIETLKEEIDRFQHENATLNSQIQDIKKNNLAKTQMKNEAFTSQLQQKNEQIAEMELQINELQKQLDSVKKDFESALNTIKEVKASNKSENQTISQKDDLILKLTYEKEELKKNLAETKSQLTKTQKTVSQQKSDIENENNKNNLLQQDMDELTQKINETEEKMRASNSQVSLIKSQLDEAHSQIIELKSENDKLKQLNEQTNNLVSGLQEKIKCSYEENGNAIKEIQLNKANVEKENISLVQTITSQQNEISEKDQQISLLQNIIDGFKQKENESVLKQNEINRVIGQIQTYTPHTSFQDLPTMMKDLSQSKINESILLQALKSKNTPEGLKIIDNLQRSYNILVSIQENLNNNEEFNDDDFGSLSLSNQMSNTTLNPEILPHQILKMKKQLQNLIQEDSFLKKTLQSSDVTIGLTKLLDNKDKMQAAINDASSFISQIAVSLLNEQSLDKIQIPIIPLFKEKIFNAIFTLKNQGTGDRKLIEALLEKAKITGYSGDDLSEAVRYITQKELQVDHEKTVTEMNKYITQLKQQLEQEQTLCKEEKSKYMKKTLNLGKKLADQQEKYQKSEEELCRQLEQSKKTIKKLQDDLQTEKQVREELGRIGQGSAANIDFLQSKLSESEMQLITLVQRLREKSDNSQKIIQQHRQLTQEFLTNTKRISH